METRIFDSNLFDKIDNYLLKQLKAKKVDSFGNNLDEIYHIYHYKSGETAEVEITVHVKEDTLLGYSTCVNAPPDILKQICNLMEK